MKRSCFVLLLVLGLVAALPAWAENKGCQQVGGVLMTNIGAIDDTYNLGPVFGDLAGSVAAKITGQQGHNFVLQHYWVTSTGDSIYFKEAVLHPTYPTDDTNIVSVLWGNYRSEITGGTGKFKNATGYLDYFGMADFNQSTLVLRYRGKVCFAN